MRRSDANAAKREKLRNRLLFWPIVAIFVLCLAEGWWGWGALERWVSGPWGGAIMLVSGAIGLALVPGLGWLAGEIAHRRYPPE